MTLISMECHNYFENKLNTELNFLYSIYLNESKNIFLNFPELIVFGIVSPYKRYQDRNFQFKTHEKNWD